MSSSQFAQIPEVILNDQTLIPQLGFGTYKVPSEDAYHVVSEALEVAVSYTHLTLPTKA